MVLSTHSLSDKLATTPEAGKLERVRNILVHQAGDVPHGAALAYCKRSIEISGFTGDTGVHANNLQCTGKERPQVFQSVAGFGRNHHRRQQ